MKFIAMPLLFIFILATEKGYGQSVKISVKSASVKKVFALIKAQTGYTFFYTDAQLERFKPVTLDLQNTQLKAALDECFKGQPFTYSIVEKMIVVKDLQPQSRGDGNEAMPRATVVGIVNDDKGRPMAGVTVTLKGSTRGLPTNENGKFTVYDLATDAVLQFSYVGYEKQEVAVKEKNFIIVKMVASDIEMQGVGVSVSNGYQTISKERSTGSFGVITGKELQQTPSTNIYDKLEGKLAGIYINDRRSVLTNTTSTLPITIRGKTSFSTGANAVNNSPLVVIDGFPYYQYGSEDILNTINPDDIDQITILKDAAASSIWGAQASYGVIVVTTKKGKRSDSPSINFSTSLSVTGKPRLETTNQMSSAEYIDLETEMVTKNVVADPASYVYSANVSQAETALFQYKRGNITLAQRDAQLGALSLVDNYGQVKKYLLQSAATQQYNLSISGGNDNHTYYISGYYADDRPVYRSNDNKSWNVTVNNTNSFLNKRVVLTTGINYIGARNQSNGAAVSALGNTSLGLRRYDNVVDDTGNAIPYAITFTPAVLSSYETKGYVNWRYSPLTELGYSNTITNNNTLRFVLGLSGKITNWLSLEASGNLEKKFGESAGLNEANSYYARNLVNSATSISSTGALVYGVPKGGILTSINTNGRSYNLRGQFNINKNWNGIHTVSILGGAEMREIYSKVASNTLYGYDPSLGTNAAFNQSTSYTTVQGFNSQIGNPNTLVQSTHRWVSYYANGSYTYLGKYVLSGSIRFDDLDVVGLSENKRAKPFWSAGAKWDISKEDFFKDIKWIDALSARGTFGINGASPQTGVSVATISTATTADLSTGQNYAYINLPANPNLGWETTKMINYSIDFSLFKRRISGSVEYYTKKTEGIIYSLPINATYGFSTLSYNSSNMKGRGWDVKITGVPIRTKNFEWSSTFVFSFNTNKVTDARLNSLAVASATGGGTPFVNYPIDYLFVYRWAGLDSTGQSQVYAADGKTKIGKTTTITDFNALKYAGRTFSPFFGGFQNSFSYKSFQLGIQTSWYMGNVFLRPSIDNYPVAATYSGYIGKQKDLAYRWRQKGDELTTNVPGITGMNSNSSLRYKSSDLLVTSGSYVRLQQISLGYSLPGKWFAGKGIKSVSLAGVVRDLGLIWTANKQGLDPAYQRSSTNTNDNILPSVNYVFRVSANF